MTEKNASTKKATSDPSLILDDIVSAMRPLLLKATIDLYEQFLPNIAEKYIEFVPRAAKSPTPQKSDVVKSLAKIKKDSAALLISIMTLKGSANSGLFHLMENADDLPGALDYVPPSMKSSYSHQPTLMEMQLLLQRLRNAASHLEDTLRTTPSVKGRKKNSAAMKVAITAANDFLRLTHKRPTRVTDRCDGKSKLSGLFPDFLSEIFKALGITANVDDCAKKAIALMDMEKKEPRVA